MAALVMVYTAICGASPAAADSDTDFADQLHGYGIYGPRDYDAWLAKITCKRLAVGVDANALGSAKFVSTNLSRGTTTQQSWQFLSAAVETYCPAEQAALNDFAQTAR